MTWEQATDIDGLGFSAGIFCKQGLRQAKGKPRQVPQGPKWQPDKESFKEFQTTVQIYVCSPITQTSLNHLKHGAECMAYVSTQRLVADGMANAWLPIGENSQNAVRLVFEVEKGMVEARYMGGIWCASTSPWVNYSEAIFQEHGVAYKDFEGLTTTMMERH